MADAEKPAENNADARPDTSASTSTKAEAPVAEKKQRKDRQTGKKVVAGANAVRSRIASLVWLVAVVCALILAVGALLIALNANQDNAIVSSSSTPRTRSTSASSAARTASSPSPARTRRPRTPWSTGASRAVVYLVVGKVLDRIIRP